MKVLYCSYEVAPFFKKGGLGDVAGSLPKALKRLGVDVRVVMPGYHEITKLRNYEITKEGSFRIEFDGREEEVNLGKTNLPASQVPIYFLENEQYLAEVKRKETALEQFAFFSKAIVEFIRYKLHAIPATPRISDGVSILSTRRESSDLDQSIGTSYTLDLVHLNDWHTAFVPLLLKLPVTHNLPLATLLTIHNLSYQGITPVNILPKLGISKDTSAVLSWDASDGDIEILMEGIIHSDIVNTVSPTYSKEILDPKFSGRIGEVLKGKEGRVYGILNGIDVDVWNPETDKFINFNYALEGRTRPDGSVGINSPEASGLFLAGRTLGWQEGKKRNKLALQKELGLEINKKTPLLAFIGRLREQKGLDILYEAVIKLLPKREFQFLSKGKNEYMQFVLLGKGNKVWEGKLKQLEEKVTRRSDRDSVLPMRVLVRFDEPLAHKIYGGADFILVPSKFEPCGLIQVIAMRYGTLPIVRKTGGLADTVKDEVNGFVFEEYSSEALIKCIRRAINKLEVGGPRFKVMVERAMSEDFSWDCSAKQYLNLYKKALEIKRGS